MSCFIEEPVAEHHKKCQDNCGKEEGPMLKCLNAAGPRGKPCPNVIHVSCLGYEIAFARLLTTFFCTDCTTNDDLLHQQLTESEKAAKCSLASGSHARVVLPSAADEEYKELRETADKMSRAFQELREKYEAEKKQTQALNEQIQVRDKAYRDLLERVKALEQASASVGSSTIAEKKRSADPATLSPHSFINYLNETLHIVEGAEEKAQTSSAPANATFTHPTVVRSESHDMTIWPDYQNQSRAAEDAGETTLTLIRSSLSKLEPFTGDVTKWSTFLSEFCRTSARGHYRDFEDLDRLRDLIRGEAREMFLAELTDPCADMAGTLKRLDEFYGVRGNAIRVALDRIAQMPKIERPHARDSIVKLYTGIKQYSLQCKYHQQTHELASQATLLIFESKMCAEHALQWRGWAKRRGRAEDVNAMIAFLENHIQELNIRAVTKNKSARANVHVTESVTGGASSSMAAHRGVESHSSQQFGSTSFSAQRGGDGGSESSSQSREGGRKSRYATCKCFYCKEKHPFYRCPKFLDANMVKRNQIVEQLHICRRCLCNDKHKSKDCPNKCMKCFAPGCKLKNVHFLLHEHVEQDASSNDPRPSTSQSCNQINPNTGTAKSHFAMVPGNVVAADETLIPITIMMDTGSGISLASNRIFHEAKCETTSEYELTLHWATNVTHYEGNAKLFDMQFLPQGHKRPILLQNLTAVEELDLPAQAQDAATFKGRCQHLKETPLPSYESQKPQILLGLPHASLITPLTTVMGKESDDPVAALTKLGWIVYGSMPTRAICRPLHEPSFLHLGCRQSNEGEPTNDELFKMIQHYNSVENIGIARSDASLLSAEDQFAGQLLESSIRFDPKLKRYEAALLWKKKVTRMPDNYEEAVIRLEASEKRLRKLGMEKFVNDQFAQQIAEGLLVETTREEANKHARRNYVYGFLTFNNNKSPPKPRWVNDTAAQFKGESLNSNLLKGPDNMVPLPQSMCAMREGIVAFQADVKSMFNQIALREEDQYSQLTLWRNCNSNNPPKIYRQTRVIFGPTCSPAIANAVRVKHARESANEFPEAAEVAEKQMYVDDAPESCNSVEEAAKVAKDLIELFDRISWPLVEFQSNSKKLLQLLPPENVSKKLAMVSNDDEEYITKILGIFWKAVIDVYVFRLNDDKLVRKCLDSGHAPTKREMLGIIMRLFDPTGMISPFRIRGQIIMQKTWKAGTDWRSKPPQEIIEQFVDWLREFDNVTKLEIPRPYAQAPLENSRLVLHVFCDASPDAYAACAYIRVEHGDDVTVRLVASKARVAPLKYLSVPRLELMAALLGARLLTAVKSWHRRLKFEECYCWTDSSVVYKWIKALHLPRTPFTAPRIAEIQELSSADCWRYVPTALNVADYATKNRAMDHGNASHEWHTGPEFVYGPSEAWPKQPACDSIAVDASVMLVKPVIGEKPLLAGVMSEVSPRVRANWSAHVRVVALALRFVDRVLPVRKKEKRRRQVGRITGFEFERAENYIIRQVQRAVFPEEFERLRAGKNVVATSKIASLCPVFCEETHLIRATTRLSVNFPYNMRRPPVLPNFNEVSDALCRYHHRLNLHVGDNVIISSLRARVWILNARGAVRRCRARCLHCIEKKKKVRVPVTADLPEFRFDIAQKPFFHTGVDLFGPFKVYSGRSKCCKEIHGVIFTCLVTRAVYLETLEDQSTECFLVAFNKLWTRRGPISHIYSDNGRNFVGAAAAIEGDEFQRWLQEKKLKWHFIPAFTPQFGGTWERLIKDIKRGLDASVGKFVVPQRNFELALTMIEANLNNRPLTEIPLSSQDEAPITPYLLLSGHPNVPVCNESAGSPLNAEVDLMKLKVVGRVNALVQLFRSRFIAEYAPVIARRVSPPKSGKNEIKLYDFVTYLDPTKNPAQWPRGVVVRVYPGKDKKTRVADVKLKNGEVLPRRSVYRLAKIDIRLDSDDAEQLKYQAVFTNARGACQLDKKEGCERKLTGMAEVHKSVHVFDDSTRAQAERGEKEKTILTEAEKQEFIEKEGKKSVFAKNFPPGLGVGDIFTIMSAFGKIKTIWVPKWNDEKPFNAIITYAKGEEIEETLKFDESRLVTVEGIAFRQSFERLTREISLRKLFRKPFFRFACIRDEFGESFRILVISEYPESKAGARKAIPLEGNIAGFVNCCLPSHKYEFEQMRVSLKDGAKAIAALPSVPKARQHVIVVEARPPDNSVVHCNQSSRDAPDNVEASPPVVNGEQRRSERRNESIEVTFRVEDPCMPNVLSRVSDERDLRELIEERRLAASVKRILSRSKSAVSSSLRFARGEDVDA